MNHFIAFITAAAFAASFVGGSHAKNANVGVQRRMRGGIETRDSQFPYHVSLQYLDKHFCSGSIIHPEWVLTAAHCLKDKYLQMLTVVAGTKQLSHGGKKIFLRKIVLHPNYLPENDIALIQVTEPFVYTGRIQPIKLNRGDVPVGANLIFGGWDSNSNELQYMNMVKRSTVECKQKFSNVKGISKNHICVYQGMGHSPSAGNSGGPLVYKGTLFGILSRGTSYTFGGVDLFTKVFTYINWIKQHIH